ncbi:hypothetical protein PFISCL1PPCAC_8468, partial [Pristionchus fissidentatus]
ADAMSEFELFSSYVTASPSSPRHDTRALFIMNRAIFIRMHLNLLRIEAREGLPDDLQRAQHVHQLREANDRSSISAPPLVYSRECPICNTPQPSVRVCYKVCGHITCLACTGEMMLQRERNCPVCREWTDYVSLHEEEEEEKTEDKRESKEEVE